MVRLIYKLIIPTESKHVTAEIGLDRMPSLHSLTIKNAPCTFSGASLPNLLVLVVQAKGYDFQIDIDDIPKEIRRIKLTWLALIQHHKASTLFSYLEEVALSDVSISNLAPGCLLAPQLGSLIIEDPLDNYDRDLSSELDILCTNGLTFGSSSLHHLELRGMGLTSRMSRNFPQLYNLKTLDLFHCQIMPEFLTLLSTPRQLDFFLPHLQRITIGGRGIKRTADILAEFHRQCAANRPSLEVLINSSASLRSSHDPLQRRRFHHV
jgi:hypothetical protein